MPAGPSACNAPPPGSSRGWLLLVVRSELTETQLEHLVLIHYRALGLLNRYFIFVYCLSSSTPRKQSPREQGLYLVHGIART